MATRKLSAFTLIELLVVISIIALLVSILLPALNAARDIAKRVMCSADQRSIGLAFHNYSYDNKGTIPPMSSPQGQAWYAYRAYEWNIKRIDDPTRASSTEHRLSGGNRAPSRPPDFVLPRPNRLIGQILEPLVFL